MGGADGGAVATLEVRCGGITSCSGALSISGLM